MALRGLESRLSRISSRTDTEIFDDGKGEKRHTIFYMNIEVGRNKYYLHKRYTEFLMLHQKLCEQQYPEIEDFDFPPKVWFNNFSDSLIEYRRTRFEAYLTLLLELVNKYPPLRKEVEAFLGVPQVIDPPKKYPKTPVPGRNVGVGGGGGGGGDVYNRPVGLLDDSEGRGGGGGAGRYFARRRSSGGEEGGGMDGSGGGGGNNNNVRAMASPTSPRQMQLLDGYGGGQAVTAAGGGGGGGVVHYQQQQQHQQNVGKVLMYLSMYMVLILLLAMTAALDPAHARVCAVTMLGLSVVAWVYVWRVFHPAGGAAGGAVAKKGM